jgi:hypothetical protein
MSEQTYEGSCHCGAVTFRVTSALDAPFQCNCSRCRRLNAVMHAAPAAAFELLSGDEVLKTYKFNHHVINHRFCTECGIQSFSTGADDKGNDMVVFNVHCLEGAEYDPARITHFNGKDF